MLERQQSNLPMDAFHKHVTIFSIFLFFINQLTKLLSDSIII